MSDDKKFPSQLAERFQVRMPDGLRDRIRDAAEHNGRSMNAEIVARLEESFTRGLMMSDEGVAESLAHIKHLIDYLDDRIQSGLRDKASSEEMLKLERALRKYDGAQSQSQKPDDTPK
ncbi:Arc family DNA-binding protein [Segnochrobactraceae bacterium EtOH-i3]